MENGYIFPYFLNIRKLVGTLRNYFYPDISMHLNAETTAEAEVHRDSLSN